jgi:hypothetical protein
MTESAAQTPDAAAGQHLDHAGSEAQRRFMRAALRPYKSLGRARVNWRAVTDPLLSRPGPSVVAGLLAALDSLPVDGAAARFLLEALVAALVRQRDHAGLIECLRRAPEVERRDRSWVYGLSREILLAQPPLDEALRRMALNAVRHPLTAGSHALAVGMVPVNAGAEWRMRVLDRAGDAFRHAVEADRALADFARFADGARTVSVVGNGPSLKGAGRGSEIEAGDLIVRCNFPPIAGFETDVGGRTDVVVSFISPAAPNFQDYFRNDPRYADAWFVQMSSNAPRDHKPIPPGGRREGPSRFVRIPLPVVEAIEDISYREPTTGLHAILLFSILLGKQVRLFGFDFFQGSLHHYWKPDAAAATSTHNPAFERLYVQRCLMPLFGVHG